MSLPGLPKTFWTFPSLRQPLKPTWTNIERTRLGNMLTLGTYFSRRTVKMFTTEGMTGRTVGRNLLRRTCGRLLVLSFLFALSLAAIECHAQTAVISDAWWTYRQDCDGDTNNAGTLPGEFARLNWFPDDTNCSGTLT